MQQHISAVALRRRISPLLGCITAALIAAHSGALYAQAPAAQRLEVSWPDIAALIEKMPPIAAGQHELEAARAHVRAERAVPNPELGGTLAWSVPRDEGASGLEWGLSLTMPLEWIAERAPKTRAANARVDWQQAETAQLRKAVYAQLQELFWTLVAAQESAALLDELLGQSQEWTRLIQLRVDRGEGRPSELVRAEIETAQLALQRDDAHATLRAHQGTLALWLSLPADTALHAVAELRELPALITRDEALAKAAAHHPSAQRSAAHIRVLESDVALEKRSRVPHFSITGFVDRELERNAFGAGLNAELPLWHWRSGRIAQAAAQLAAARSTADAERLQVQTSVLHAHTTCEQAATRAAQFRDRWLPRTQSLTDSMTQSFSLGEANLLELIDARRSHIDVQQQYITALCEAQISCRQLDAWLAEEAP
ncbi:MAG: TolC family protein [Myxococcales bacterium]|jgi:outer membrane protein TolC|nr:TolC family protein [Myxococcales bacterium]